VDESWTGWAFTGGKWVAVCRRRQRRDCSVALAVASDGLKLTEAEVAITRGRPPSWRPEAVPARRWVR
jgi:hypothetical protein